MQRFLWFLISNIKCLANLGCDFTKWNLSQVLPSVAEETGLSKTEIPLNKFSKQCILIKFIFVIKGIHTGEVINTREDLEAF